MTAPGTVNLKQRLESAIEDTRRMTRCHSIAIARKDGLVIVHRLGLEFDPRLAAAMAAATIGAAGAAARELRQGAVEHVIVECKEGKILAMEAGPDAILIALYDPEANLGLAIHGLDLASRTIEEILRGM